jgi:hypothetical protein
MGSRQASIDQGDHSLNGSMKTGRTPGVAPCPRLVAPHTRATLEAKRDETMPESHSYWSGGGIVRRSTPVVTTLFPGISLSRCVSLELTMKRCTNSSTLRLSLARCLSSCSLLVVALKTVMTQARAKACDRKGPGERRAAINLHSCCLARSPVM